MQSGRPAGDTSRVVEFVRASSWLGGAVLDFVGGDRVVMFEASTSRSDAEGASLAVLEMWAVASVAGAVVVTEQSSFILPTSAMYPKPTAAFAVRKGGAERGGWGHGRGWQAVRQGAVFECYLLQSGGEPSCATPAGRYGCS
jgi:hypothetical protein